MYLLLIDVATGGWQLERTEQEAVSDDFYLDPQFEDHETNNDDNNDEPAYESREDPDYRNDSEDEVTNEPEPSTSRGGKWKPVKKSKSTENTKKKSNTCNWRKGPFHLVEIVEKRVDVMVSSRENWTPKMYVFGKDMIQSLRQHTETKILIETKKATKITFGSMCIFIGAIVLMSCLNLPRIRMYWSKVTSVARIVDFMTWDQYFLIRKHLKVVEDNLVSRSARTEDKFWKIRPSQRQGSLTLPRGSKLAVDEHLIPFTGSACVMKQFVPNKPNPEGLKNFVLAAPNGLVLDFELYQGK
ncbi:hypothetical protein GE061_014081 [Apolygus lucorum]|uniref:PiggyBac transposable element-derived protein domain-containing protein n=1 Tax=Apolygus lucorum TaxID=248454 RepID=A0A8S9XRX0_APOLU|nr:hypothetical protein GE061_014081 [Apolygus lucorum]